jgi:hypothetical protein
MQKWDGKRPAINWLLRVAEKKIIAYRNGERAGDSDGYDGCTGGRRRTPLCLRTCTRRRCRSRTCPKMPTGRSGFVDGGERVSD